MPQRIIPQSATAGRDRLFAHFGEPQIRKESASVAADVLTQASKTRENSLLARTRSPRGLVGREELAPSAKSLESEIISKASKSLTKALCELGMKTGIELGVQDVTIESVGQRGLLKKTSFVEEGAVTFTMSTPMTKLHRLDPHLVKVEFKDGEVSSISPRGYEFTVEGIREATEESLVRKSSSEPSYNFVHFWVDSDYPQGDLRVLSSVINPGRVIAELRKNGFLTWRQGDVYEVTATNNDVSTVRSIISKIGEAPQAKDKSTEGEETDVDAFIENLDGLNDSLRRVLRRVQEAS